MRVDLVDLNHLLLSVVLKHYVDVNNALPTHRTSPHGFANPSRLSSRTWTSYWNEGLGVGNLVGVNWYI